MAVLGADINDAPDEIRALPPGVYKFVVEEANDAETKAGKPKVVCKLVVTDNEEHNGRVVMDHMSVSFPVALKQIAKSAGIDISDGLNTVDLIGKIVVGRVIADTYTDDSGKVKETARIEQYLCEEAPDGIPV